MKNHIFRIVIFGLIPAIILGSCNGSKVNPDQVTDEVVVDSAETMTEVTDNRLEEVTEQEGSLIYFAGDVEWSGSDNDAWLPAEIGQIVRTGDSLRTFEDSWCELKFSDQSLIRLRANTLFVVEAIYDAKTSSSGLRGRITRGSIAAKVKKLTGRESLEIVTPTVACAVRGTIFLVSADDVETVIAVSEGSVAIIPEGLNLSERLENADENTLETLERLEASLPLISAGDEIILGAREQNDLEIEVLEISSILDSSELDSKALDDSLDNMAKAIGLSSTELSDESREILEPLEREGLTEELSEDVNDRVTVSWEFLPKDAEVSINGLIHGRGSLSGTWMEGEILELQAARPGYRDFSSVYTAELTDGSLVHQVSLEKLPTHYFDLYASPGDSQIVVDGVDRGTVYKGAVSWEQISHIRVTKENYNERRFLMEYDDPPEGRIDVNLESTIMAVVPTKNEKIVGLEAVNNNVVAAYSDGSLQGLSLNGDRLWRPYISTNNPNESARPQEIGGRIFFSGGNEFVILDGESGSKISSTNQDPKTMHLLGRHSVPFGTFAAYPATDAIILIKPSDGSVVRRIELSEKCEMTPFVYSGNIYTISTNGTVFGFDAQGNEIARIPTPAIKPIGNAPAVSGDSAFFGDRKGTIFAVNLRDKKLDWEVTVGGAIQDDPAVTGAYLVLYSNHDVFVLRTANGSTHIRPIRGFSSAPVVAEGFLYGGLETGELISVAIQSGEEVSRISMNGQVSSNGVDLSDTVIFGTDVGEIYIVNKQDPSLIRIPPERGTVE